MTKKVIVTSKMLIYPPTNMVVRSTMVEVGKRIPPMVQILPQSV